MLRVALATSAFHRAAWAGDAQEQRLAQALFDDARRLMEAKRYSEACPKLLESQRLDPGGGTLLNLAVCHEKEGKLATAKNDFEEALALAVKDGRKDRQRIAVERIGALEPTIPRVTVVVAPPSELDGLEVKLDGLVLRRAAWGVATPVDPGTHVIEASATGRAPWSTTVQAAPAQRKTVDVPVLGPLTPLPFAALVAPAPIPVLDDGSGIQRPMIVTEPSAPTYAEPAAPASSGTANPVYYTVLATTLALTATSAVTGIMALSANADAKDGCLPDRTYCRDARAADAADRARTLAWASTVTLGAAGVGVVALILLPSRSSPSRLRGSALLLPGGGSVGLGGSF